MRARNARASAAPSNPRANRWRHHPEDIPDVSGRAAPPQGASWLSLARSSDNFFHSSAEVAELLAVAVALAADPEAHAPSRSFPGVAASNGNGAPHIEFVLGPLAVRRHRTRDTSHSSSARGPRPGQR